MKVNLGLMAILLGLSLPSHGTENTSESKIIFTRVIGGLTKSNPRSYYQRCEIRKNQLEDIAKVQGNLKTLPSEKVKVAYPFVAFVPSREYFYEENGQQHLIARYSSAIESKESSQKLMDTIDQICGSYDQNRNRPKISDGKK